MHSLPFSIARIANVSTRRKMRPVLPSERSSTDVRQRSSSSCEDQRRAGGDRRPAFAAMLDMMDAGEGMSILPGGAVGIESAGGLGAVQEDGVGEHHASGGGFEMGAMVRHGGLTICRDRAGSTKRRVTPKRLATASMSPVVPMKCWKARHSSAGVILSWWKFVAVEVSESSASSPVSTMTGTSKSASLIDPRSARRRSARQRRPPSNTS